MHMHEPMKWQAADPYTSVSDNKLYVIQRIFRDTARWYEAAFLGNQNNDAEIIGTNIIDVRIAKQLCEAHNEKTNS